MTEEVTWHGHRCLFLRCNTDHHCLAVYPLALARGTEPAAPIAMNLSFGVKLYDYQQLRDAVAFLKKHGVRILNLPPELFPGMDYTAFAVDPDGHLVQLYYYMEQIGWDGKPKPAQSAPQGRQRELAGNGAGACPTPSTASHSLAPGAERR